MKKKIKNIKKLFFLFIFCFFRLFLFLHIWTFKMPIFIIYTTLLMFSTARKYIFENDINIVSFNKYMTPFHDKTRPKLSVMGTSILFDK